MKVGIVGDATRAVAWEQHLRPHRMVKEVDLCPQITDIGEVDACIIIDDTDQNLDILLSGIRQKLNCFLVSKTPTDKNILSKIHQSAKEAGVYVQISHWPVLAPATQWMMNRMKRPTSIHIARDLAYTQWTNSEAEFKQLWYDEVGFCLKWMNSGIHHIEVKKILLENTIPIFMHLFLRFDNGSTASITISTTSREHKHMRMAFNKKEMLECEVREQAIRIGQLNGSSQLYFEKQQFDPATAAEKAALMFLKAIQMNTETVYSSYHAMMLAAHIEKINNRLKQFV